MKTDILAFGAHPDDVELSCSGTIIKHVLMGKTAGIIDLTRGELGTRGDAATREAEAREAGKIMGIKFRENMNFADGFFENSKENQLALVVVIRKYMPEIVLANAIADRHPDHARGAQLVADACFLAGLKKIETVENGKPQNAWRPKAVYHYIQDRYMKPDFVVDISSQIEQRMLAIKAYRSQFYDEQSKEPQTPISSKQFMDSLYYRPMEFGRMTGVEFAEGFVAERLIGVDNLFELK